MPPSNQQNPYPPQPPQPPQPPIQPQPPQQPMMQQQPHIGQFEPKKSRKGLFAAFGGIVSVLALGVAYYVLMYLPNTPENVYRRGVASIGVGLEQLIEDQTFNPTQANQFEGSFTMSTPFEVTVDFDGTTTVNGEGDFTIDAAFLDYNPKLETYYTLLNDQYPEFYFKFSGIERLINDYAGPELLEYYSGGESLEDIWWLFSFEELASLGYVSDAEVDEFVGEGSNDLTTEDYQKLMQAFINASNQYVFTPTVDDMVLQRVEDLGTEEYEGVNSNKYLVEVNKQNLKNYLIMLRDEIIATGVIEKVSPDYDLTEDMSDADINEAVDEMDFSEVRIEAWVGLNNKVLRNIRFTPIGDDVDGSFYLDVSLLLDDTNLDVIPLRIKYVGDDDEAAGFVTLNFISNIAENSFEMTMDADIDYKSEFDDDYRMAANLKLTGLSEEPVFEQPENPRSIIELIFGDAQQNAFSPISPVDQSLQAQDF